MRIIPIILLKISCSVFGREAVSNSKGGHQAPESAPGTWPPTRTCMGGHNMDVAHHLFYRRAFYAFSYFSPRFPVRACQARRCPAQHR